MEDVMNFGDGRLPERFWSKVIPEPNSGCWIWTASCDTTGYGRLSLGPRGSNRLTPAHRFAYEALVGIIPVGLQIDHLCRVRCCVNPRHMEAVTPRVNTLRGTGATAVNAAKTICRRGHDLPPYEGVARGECAACRITWNQISNAKRRGQPRIRRRAA